MLKLCILVSSTLFSYAGWYLGSQFGGMMTAFFVSGVLSLVGVWAGWAFHRRYLY